MKKFIRACIFLLSVSAMHLGVAQDVPLFTQQLTNSFTYNPAVAGSGVGSATFSHRRFWTGAVDAPQTSFLSMHTPFQNYRFGTGLNFYQDKIGPVTNLYLSGAFSYHINISDRQSFSMGLSAEYDNQRYNASAFDPQDDDDMALNRVGGSDGFDFSFGLSYRLGYFTLGAATNRIRAFAQPEHKNLPTTFPAFYSLNLRGSIPVRSEKDLFEPFVTYRGFINRSKQIDAGAYYTANDLITVGAGYRTGEIINATLGIKFFKSLLVGYSRDIYSGDVSKAVGTSHEITLRYDFLNQAFYKRWNNAGAIGSRAVAVKRKALNASPNKSNTASQNKRIAQRKGYLSPNYRISNSSKLLNSKNRKSKGYNKKKRR